MPIRMIHTSDIHLDACMGSAMTLAGFGNRRRQSLRDVFASIVKRAGSWPADALLIAGDLFEHERVGRDTVAFLRSQFESIAHVPVFIAPGNHDPYIASSPYVSATWPQNVFIFDRPAWTSHAVQNGGMVVHGFGFDGVDISVNPFGSLETPDYGDVHVGVAHGSERGHQPTGKNVYAPFSASTHVAGTLAYLALGHLHGATELTDAANRCAWYSGAPEGHGFGETGVRHYLEVEIDGSDTRVKMVPSSRVIYEVHRIDCAGLESAQELVNGLRALAEKSGPEQVMRVELRGSCLPSIREALSTVHDAVVGYFEHFEIVNETDNPEDYGHVARSGGSLGAFVGQLNGELEDATDEERARLVGRARDVGLAAYRGQTLDIRGLERGRT